MPFTSRAFGPLIFCLGWAVGCQPAHRSASSAPTPATARASEPAPVPEDLLGTWVEASVNQKLTCPGPSPWEGREKRQLQLRAGEKGELLVRVNFKNETEGCELAFSRTSGALWVARKDSACGHYRTGLRVREGELERTATGLRTHLFAWAFSLAEPCELVSDGTWTRVPGVETSSSAQEVRP
jgi:hypothetical protein